MLAFIRSTADDVSTRNGEGTYPSSARGRPASRRIPSPPECLPRVLYGRAVVGGMKADGFTFAEQRDYLAEKEEKLRRILLTAEVDGSKPRAIKKAAEDWWSCAAEIFELYQQAAHEDLAAQIMPANFLGVMARMSRVAAKGRLPSTLRFASKHQASYRKNADIATAIVFIEAAKLEANNAENPVSLVAWAYGVSEVLVRTWVRDKKRYLPGFEPETDFARMENAMLHAGSRYRADQEAGEASEVSSSSET